MKFLVTGAAGFIGYHVCKALLEKGEVVHGLDNLNAFYDVSLKQARLHNLLNKNGSFCFYEQDLIHATTLFEIFDEIKPDVVIHLAAQAGVRHSIDHPQSFIDSNVQGFFNVMEACRRYPVDHFIYASSSSVYGNHSEIPFRENANTDQPVSLYGATKKAGEVLAHAYVELYKIPTTGLRFFTVYGPWGRPDMAYYKFADHIMAGKTIDVYNHGEMQRDFTYIDDIVSGIMSVIDRPPANGLSTCHQILNIGRNHPVTLGIFISLLEKYLGREARCNYMPLQAGEVESTWADTTALHDLTGYAPSTDLEEGIHNFVQWYTSYHSIN